MVDQSDLDKINMLNAELRTASDALDIFDHGGRIVSMTVSSAEGDPVSRSRLVQTATVIYPQQMVDEIKSFLNTRIEDVRNALLTLGVTGVDTQWPPRR